MAAGHITSFDDALANATDGAAVTLGAARGSLRLEQRAERIPAGSRRARTINGSHEVMFVAAGRGTLRLGGESYALVPETGVFAAEGDRVELVNDGGEPLDIVTVRTPADHAAPPGRRVTVKYDDRPALSAGIGREFRVLVGEETGCFDVTQFIGVVPPGRAEMHSHEYDEVAFIVEGVGAVHWPDGTSVDVARGSCIHFPRLVPHSLENRGSSPLRVMGVFHPAGSPAARVEPDGE
jgi:mannose-6-phosphate isomerase-like protein (cupin superfamily)